MMFPTSRTRSKPPRGSPFFALVLVMAGGVWMAGGIGFGCGKDKANTGGEAVAAPVTAAGEAASEDPTSLPSGGEPSDVVSDSPPERPEIDPEALYAQCRKRVEGIEADGECSTDADCARAGCSQEVCLSAANADGLATTCDAQLCFDVLQACGCNAGRCSWTIGMPTQSAEPIPLKKLDEDAQ